jgi:hypothetical protein
MESKDLHRLTALPEAEMPRGQQHGGKAGTDAKALRSVSCKTCVTRQKLNCLKPSPSRCIRTPAGERQSTATPPVSNCDDDLAHLRRRDNGNEPPKGTNRLPTSRCPCCCTESRDRPSGREPHGDGVPIVVRGRESRPHGEGGQVTRQRKTERYARCETPTLY